MSGQDPNRDTADPGLRTPAPLIGLLVVLALSAAIAAASTPTWWPVVIAVAVAIGIVVVVAWRLGADTTPPSPADDVAPKPGADLIAAVSHDLRTPLATMGAYVELLEAGDAGELSAEQRKLLAVVEENVQRAYALADDLIELRAAGAAEPTEVPVGEVVARAIRAVRPSAEARGLDIEFDSDLDTAAIRGNATALDRILVNLLSNAVKFTPDGGTITVRAVIEDDTAVISVADTGHGIAEHEQQRIFDRYYRADNVRDGRVPGSGLGLAIVRELVTQHGGTVEVSSKPGKGATFTLRLPAHDPGVR